MMYFYIHFSKISYFLKEIVTENYIISNMQFESGFLTSFLIHFHKPKQVGYQLNLCHGV